MGVITKSISVNSGGKHTSIRETCSNSNFMPLISAVDPRKRSYIFSANNYTSRSENVYVLNGQNSRDLVSTKTANYFSKKIVRVIWKPKKLPKMPSQPVSPNYKPQLKFKPILPKGLRGSESKPYKGRNPEKQRLYNLRKSKRSSANQKLVRRFAKINRARSERIARINLRRKAKNDLKRQKYDKAMKKYKERLLVYYKLADFYINGKPRLLRSKRVNTCSATENWNPLTDIRFVDNGASVVNQWKLKSHNSYRDKIYSRELNYSHGWHPSTTGIDNTAVQPVNDNATYQGLRSGAKNRANMVLEKKFRKELSDQYIHIGNMAAESAKTLKMLSDLLKRVLMLRKFKFSLDIPSDYLQFQFGLRPLMNDIYKLFTGSPKDFSESLITFRVSTKRTTIESIPLGSIVNDGITSVTSEDLVSIETRLTRYYEYRIKNSTLASLQNVGLLNPAEVAWEILPFSFVIDWFLPIGQWIAALSAHSNLEFVRALEVEVHREEHFLHAVYGPKEWTRGNSGTYWYKGGGDGYCSWTRTFKYRRLISPTNVPIPDFKNPFSFTHLAESLALILQRFR